MTPYRVTAMRPLQMITGQCELTNEGWKAGLSMWECIFSCVRFVVVLMYEF